MMMIIKPANEIQPDQRSDVSMCCAPFARQRSLPVRPLARVSSRANAEARAMSALLFYGDTQRSAALRHEIPLAIIDPLLFAEADGQKYVLTSFLEAERVKRALPGVELLDYFELGYKDL